MNENVTNLRKVVFLQQKVDEYQTALDRIMSAREKLFVLREATRD